MAQLWYGRSSRKRRYRLRCTERTEARPSRIAAGNSESARRRSIPERGAPPLGREHTAIGSGSTTMTMRCSNTWSSASRRSARRGGSRRRSPHGIHVECGGRGNPRRPSAEQPASRTSVNGTCPTRAAHRGTNQSSRAAHRGKTPLLETQMRALRARCPSSAAAGRWASTCPIRWCR